MNKVCSKCKQEFPATTEYFKPRKDSKDGLRGQCIKCVSQVRRKHYLDNQEKLIAKTAKYYKENLDHCKKYHKERYLNNKELWQDAHKKRYSEKREEIIEYQKQYRSENIFKIRQYHKNYRAENKNILKRRRRIFYIKNKDKVDVANQKREASKRELPNSLTVKQWEECKQYFRNECCYCGENKELAQDHFVPLSKGGEYTLNNIVPACKSCNSSKKDRDFFEWYPQWEHYSPKREQQILRYLNYNSNKLQQLALL